MHAGELLGDGVLRPVLLLRQALDPPDLGQELTDLLVYIPAILLGHKSTGSPGFSFRYSLSLYSFASSEILSVMGSIILNYSSCLPILFDIRYPYLFLQLASLAILPFYLLINGIEIEAAPTRAAQSLATPYLNNVP